MDTDTRGQAGTPPLGCSGGNGLEPEADPDFPVSLMRALPQYFTKLPQPLCSGSSFSGNGPLLATCESAAPLVLRRCTWEQGCCLLALTEDLNRRTHDAMGRRLYAELRGETAATPWGGEDEMCYVLQEFRPEHRPEALYALKDIDVLELGKECGCLQKVLSDVSPDLWPPGSGLCAPSLPLAARVELMRPRLESPSTLQLPPDHAEWLCGSTEQVLEALRAIGAFGFTETLVDCDLNLRNAAVVPGITGAASLSGIFDPDFCPGYACDALRRPAHAFSSRRPRLILEDLLARDLDAFGGARFVLFLRGYLGEHGLSREELLAIPLLEKLELLTYRLFEDDSPEASLRVHADRFRQLTRELVERIDGMNWSRTVAGLLPRTVSMVLSSSAMEVNKGQPRKRQTAGERLSEQARPYLAQIDRIDPPAGDRCSLGLAEGWTAVMTRRKAGQDARWRIFEGYPFPISEVPLRASAESPWEAWDLSLHLHGKPLHARQQDELVHELRIAFPELSVSVGTCSASEMRDACEPLMGLARGSRLLLLDPFRYLGDSSYVGYYYQMLHTVSPDARVLAMSRNEAVWSLFDCELVRDIGELPVELAGAVLPAFIDDQWETILRLAVPAVVRAPLVVIPQRDLVIRKDVGRGEILVLHTGQPATPLRCSNVAHQTWHGLARLLPDCVPLQNAKAMFQPAVTRTLYLPRSAPIFRRVFLNPFTSKATKDLPPDLCLRVIDLLHQRLGTDMTLWISGGSPNVPSHREMAAEVQRCAAGKCRSTVVRASLEDVVTTMTSMDLVVTADTSISHLAAHKGIPCLVLWNVQNWDTNSPLDMVHNGPVGFSCCVPFCLDVTFARPHAGDRAQEVVELRNLELAMGLLEAILSGPPQVLSPGTGLEPQSVLDLTQSIEDLLYGREGFDPQAVLAHLLALAEKAEQAMRSLQPKWVAFAQGLGAPFSPDWMLDRLHHPEQIAFDDLREQCCFAHAVWLANPLYKILLSCEETGKRRLRHSRRFLLAQGENDYRPACSRTTTSLLAMPLEMLRQTIISQGDVIRQGYLDRACWQELAGNLGIRDEFAPAEGRLRQCGDSFLFSLKGEGDTEQSQYETRISEPLFTRFWNHTAGRRVEKFRLQTSGQSALLALDWLPDRQMLLAEVDGEDPLPDDVATLGKDVTHDPAYRNRALAR
jgi:hypothetical protein